MFGYLMGMVRANEGHKLAFLQRYGITGRTSWAIIVAISPVSLPWKSNYNADATFIGFHKDRFFTTTAFL